MDLQVILASLGAFLAAAGAVVVAWRVYRGDERVEERLNQLSTKGRAQGSNLFKKQTMAARVVQTALPKFAASLVPNDRKQRLRLQARLMHAGIYAPHALITFQIAKAVLSIVPPFVGCLLGYLQVLPLQKGLLMGGIAGGIGMILPSFWLDRRKTLRQRQLNRSLPDALDLMVTCTEAGLSFEASLVRVTDELQIAHPVLAGEMSVVQKQIAFGAPPDVAIANFAERTDLEALSTLGTLVQQARRFGTGIADALRTHAEMIRCQREQLAEELAQKAAVKILIPTLLLIFPAIFVVLAGPAAIQLNEAFAKQNESKASRRR